MLKDICWATVMFGA